MNIWFLYLLVFSLSAIFTAGLRAYALSKKLLDIPNERSSHVIPTPRGGGLAFVILFFIGLIACYHLGLMPEQIFIGILLPCFCIAAIGFVDDRKGLSAKVRLIGHLGSSLFAVIILGRIPSLPLGVFVISSTLILFIFSVFYLAWLLNLFNFMDGIDGLAAMEAITISAGMAFLCFIHGQLLEAYLLFYLGAVVAGFLVWNFPPAKIFMGDVGSGFLGISLGLFSLLASQNNPQSLYAWLVLLGVFVVDATYTLIERFIKGEKIWEAHRSHAYQYAAHYYGSHKVVTLTILLINLCWLFPWAFLIYENCVNGFLGLMCAYIPLICLVFKTKRHCA